MTLDIRTVMLIHGDVEWCQATALALAAHEVAIRWGATRECAEALAAAGRFDAAILDADTLGADETLAVIDLLAACTPAPAVVVWGTRFQAHHAFALGRSGVRSLIAERPLPEGVFRIVAEATSAPPVYEPQIRALVGAIGLERLVTRVRDVAGQQALGLARGNRSHAAQLLQVSRQAVQQMIRRASARQAAEPSRGGVARAG